MTDDLLTERERADALLAGGQTAEAVSLYRRLVERCPDEDSHRLALAWVLLDSGARQEAVETFEALFDRELERKVWTGFAYDELVRLHRADGNWKALLSVCRRAAATWPEESGLRRTLGEACLAAGKTAEAMEVFAALARLCPDDPGPWAALGEARLASGDPTAAEAAYDRAVGAGGGDEAILRSRQAATTLRAGFPERACALWRRCLDLKPEEPLYWMGLGEALIGCERWEAGEKAFGRAAALDPASGGSCWHRLARLLTAGQRLEAAVAVLRRAAAAEPGNPRYRLELAAACAAAGQTDEALTLLQGMENPDPESSP